MVSDDDVEEQVEQLHKRFATTPVSWSVPPRPGSGPRGRQGELDGEMNSMISPAPRCPFEVGAGGMIDGFSEAVTGASGVTP